MRRIPAFAVDSSPSSSGSWFADAACLGTDPEPFFDGDDAEGIAICRTCPVASACLDYALMERLTDGVWGGVDGDDRRAIAKARGMTWETEAPARRECVCGRWARPSRTLCSACAQRAYRASRA